MEDRGHGRLSIRPRGFPSDAAWKRAINPENDGPASIDAGPSSMKCKTGLYRVDSQSEPKSHLNSRPIEIQCLVEVVGTEVRERGERIGHGHRLGSGRRSRSSRGLGAGGSADQQIGRELVLSLIHEVLDELEVLSLELLTRGLQAVDLGAGAAAGSEPVGALTSRSAGNSF